MKTVLMQVVNNNGDLPLQSNFPSLKLYFSITDKHNPQGNTKSKKERREVLWIIQQEKLKLDLLHDPLCNAQLPNSCTEDQLFLFPNGIYIHALFCFFDICKLSWKARVLSFPFAFSSRTVDEFRFCVKGRPICLYLFIV